MWGERAIAEFNGAAHTWFATIEWSPREHAVSDADVEAELRTLAQPQDGSSSYPRFRKALFKARVKVMSKAVTRWLEAFREKRRRALGRAPRFSYLLVAEEHKGTRKMKDGSATSGLLKGRPHFHLLVHEEVEGELIPRDQWYVTKKGDTRADDKSDIRVAWPFEGYTQFDKLEADEGWRCRYICKYLGKEEQHWRVRASIKYGEQPEKDCEAVSTPPSRDCVKADQLGICAPEKSGSTEPTSPGAQPRGGGVEDDRADCGKDAPDTHCTSPKEGPSGNRASGSGAEKHPRDGPLGAMLWL